MSMTAKTRTKGPKSRTRELPPIAPQLPQLSCRSRARARGQNESGIATTFRPRNDEVVRRSVGTMPMIRRDLAPPRTVAHRSEDARRTMSCITSRRPMAARRLHGLMMTILTVQCQTSSRPSDRQSPAFRVNETAGRATRLRLTIGTWGCRDCGPTVALSWSEAAAAPWDARDYERRRAVESGGTQGFMKVMVDSRKKTVCGAALLRSTEDQWLRHASI